MAQGNLSSNYVSALSIVDDVVISNRLNDSRPWILHHYTSLEVGYKIITNKEIRLNHCEYSNDYEEIRYAIALVRKEIERLISKSNIYKNEREFYENVLNVFEARTSLYEAFVFCMSEGDQSARPPQDVLSMWRAYGRDGRGVCLSFESTSFDITNNQSTLRLNKVIYDQSTQERVVQETLDKGWTHLNSSKPGNSSSMNNASNSISATVVALMFFIPIMKNWAFSEEREWRFIYVPEPQEEDLKDRQFYPRQDGLLVPFYLYGRKSNVLPKILEIMIGPSPYQELSLRSLEYVRGRSTLRYSSIPYRSSLT